MYGSGALSYVKGSWVEFYMAGSVPSLFVASSASMYRTAASRGSRPLARSTC